MARTDNTPWISEGPLRVRFRQVGTKLVRETNQPDRDLIMDQIQDERRDGRRQPFLGGYKVCSIPLVDWERVKQKYPELQSGDQELARAALIRFSHDPEMQKYLIEAA